MSRPDPMAARMAEPGAVIVTLEVLEQTIMFVRHPGGKVDLQTNRGDGLVTLTFTPEKLEQMREVFA